MRIISAILTFYGHLHPSARDAPSTIRPTSARVSAQIQR